MLVDAPKPEQARSYAKIGKSQRAEVVLKVTETLLSAVSYVLALVIFLCLPEICAAGTLYVAITAIFTLGMLEFLLIIAWLPFATKAPILKGINAMFMMAALLTESTMAAMLLWNIPTGPLDVCTKPGIASSSSDTLLGIVLTSMIHVSAVLYMLSLPYASELLQE